MAISVSDSVARWTGWINRSASITSASFTPADNSLLVLCVNWDETTTDLVNPYTVSGGSLTWTERVERNANDSGATNGGAAIWTAPVTTGASMTIVVARTAAGYVGEQRFSAKVYVVTGQAASPIGTTGEGSSTTNNISPTLFTSTGAGRAFYAGTDWNALGLPTSTDTESAEHNSGQISLLSAYKATDHAASATVSGNLDASGTSAADWNWVALEILAATTGGETVTPGAGSLTITGAAPTIFRTQSAAPGVAALTVTGFAPTVKVTQSASPGVGALSITGLAPTVAVTNNLIAQPGAGALSITGAAPTANLTQSAAPGVGALTLTGFAPTANLKQSVAPGAGALTVTGLAPTVRVSLSASPGVGALTITGAAPVANVTQSAAPGAGAIVLTGHAPSVVVSAAGTVNPGVAALDITGHAPTANVSQSVAPGYADILLTGFAPTISIASADKIVAPGLAALFLVGYAPEAIVSGQKRAEAGSSKRKRRARYVRLPEDIERERQEQEEQETQQEQAKPEPKRAKRTGKASRGIRLAPDLEAQRAAEILAARTAELMAQQQGERRALLAEELAMLEAAAAIDAENEMIMLLLMAA